MRLAALAAIALSPALVGAQSGTGGLPPPQDQAKQEFTLLNAEFVESLLGDDISVSGNVHAQYRGYDMYADRVVGDRKTQVFSLFGNCRLVGKGADVKGDQITIDFKTDAFWFNVGEATLSPEALQGESRKDVFLRTSSGQGTFGRFTILDGAVTTCDLETPHTMFEVSSTRVRPGKYAALRDAKLNVLGHTILQVPYLVIPLIENGTKYLPDVGQSPTEGTYIKTRFSTPLRGEDYIDTRLEYMTALGTGVGADLNYENDSMNGKLSTYALLGDQRSATISASHKHEAGKGRILLDANYQRLNYLTAPESTLLNSRLQYVLPWTNGNSRLSWYRVASDTSTFSSVNQSVALNDQHAWSRNLSTSLDVSLNRAETESAFIDTKTQRVDLRFNTRTDLRSFSADLLYQRSVPIGDTTNFFNATDKTPMLTVKSDATRLFGAGFARTMPLTTEMSIGELADPTNGGTISRIDYNVNAQRREKVGDSTLTLTGGFKQGIYSDDTAQYVLDYGIGLSTPFGGRSKFDVNYRNHRAFGYTPLSMDRTGRNDALSIDLLYQATKTLELSARTGYDVLQADRGSVPWQQVWVRSNWAPSQHFQVRTSATYDTFNQVWGNNRIDIGYADGDFRVALGSRYDGRRSIWGGTSLMVQGFKYGKTTFSTALDWNGYAQRFEAQHYSFVYSLHEAEAVLDIIDNQVGFRSGRQIAFFVRLKAFPTRSMFGSGTRGQAVGTQPGFGF